MAIRYEIYQFSYYCKAFILKQDTYAYYALTLFSFFVFDGKVK